MPSICVGARAVRHSVGLHRPQHHDVARLIADLTTPALFVLCREHDERPADQMRTRQQLAEHATRHGHTVRWVDADHGFAVEQPERSGQIITDFLATLSPVST